MPPAGPASAARRPWLAAGVLVVVPAVAAAAVIAALPSGTATAAAAVTVTRTGCARDWTAARAGTRTFTVANQSGKAGEINLVNAAGGVVGGDRDAGPGHLGPADRDARPGFLRVQVLPVRAGRDDSAAVQVTGRAVRAAPAAVKPVTVRDLAGPNQAYQRYAAAQLRDLAAAVARSRPGCGAATWPRPAPAGWPPSWPGSGPVRPTTVSATTAPRWPGCPTGCPPGWRTGTSPGCTGWSTGCGTRHGQARRAAAGGGHAGQRRGPGPAQSGRGDLAGDPTNLPVRAHEILEDALRDHLSGLDDQGSGAAYPETYADLQVTRAVLGDLSALISARSRA